MHLSWPNVAFLSVIVMAASAADGVPPTLIPPGQELGSGEQMVEASAHGARLICPIQDLEGWLSPNGLELRSVGDGEPGAGRMRTRVLARPGWSVVLPAGEVVVASGVARLIRPGLIEEVTTSSAGIRQDWLVSERPPGDGPLSLSIAIDGAVITMVEDRRVDLTLAGGRQMTWHALDVRDAVGTALPAHFTRQGGDIVIAIDDVGARYPVRIDPTFTDSDWFTIGQYPGTWGSVRAMTVFGSDLVVAGSFTMAGAVSGTSYIARWNGSAWSALGTGMNDAVNALTVIGTDLYAGGAFTTAGGSPAVRVAKWNGSAWSAVGTAGDQPVTAMAVIGTTLHAAGRFPDGSGGAFFVAKWTGSAWTAVGDGLLGGRMTSGDRIEAMAVIGTTLYAGGLVSTSPGAAMMKWDGSTWSLMDTGVHGIVHACHVVGSDLYVGGDISCTAFAGVNNIYKWNGSAWSEMAAGLDEPVHAIGSHAGTIYAGGEEHWNSTIRGRVKQWSGSAWSDTGSKRLGNIVRCMASYGGELVVGGDFTGAGDWTVSDNNGLPGVSRLSSGAWTVLGNGLLGNVHAIATIGSDVYVGGQFTAAGGAYIRNLAKWNGSAWSQLGSGLDGYMVRALHVMGGKLYVGGSFSNAGGVSANCIACWDGAGWSALAAGCPSMVNALASQGGELYAGGDSTVTLGTPLGFIVRWTGSAWSAMGSGTNGAVSAIAVHAGEVYAGGTFSQIDGASASRIARWNGSAWSPLTSGMQLGNVKSLAVNDGSLYVGGDFTYAGGIYSPGLARWSGSAWSSIAGGMSGSVECLLVRGGDLYVGGGFGAIGGISATSIARWNGSSWNALGSGTTFVMAMGATGTDLFVGDYTGYAGGQYRAPFKRAHLTALPATPSDANVSTNQVAESAAIGAVTGLTVAAADPEAAAVSFSLDINAGGRFAIHSTTGVVTVAGALNYESATNHTIRVRVTDGINSAIQTFTIAVTDVNEPPSAPVDADPAVNQATEGAPVGTAVGLTASASDPEASAIVFDLTDSAGGRFAIHPTTGVVTQVGAVDHATATTHSITVRASVGGQTSSSNFAVAVLSAPPSGSGSPAGGAGGGGGCGLGGGMVVLVGLLTFALRRRHI